MDFKFGVLVTIVAQICLTQALPPCTCTRNYRPVCASNGETYANPCLMECAGTHLTIVREGPCDLPAPECICPYNYLPVCGTDRVTYPNECTLECHRRAHPDVQKQQDGACPTTPAPRDPPCTCTRDTAPVCGSDGKTYANSCLLNCATIHNSMLSIEHRGPCDDKVKVVNFVDKVKVVNPVDKVQVVDY